MEYLKIAFISALLLCITGRATAQQATGEPAIFSVAEIAPEFPGGEQQLLRFIAEQTHYPEKSRERGEQGTVMVQFVVNEDGSVSNATVLRGVSRLLDAEAIRVVQSMPIWKPGYQRGKPVKVYYKLPFRFALEGVEEAPQKK